MKYNNLDARHIICACILGSERTVRDEDYEDDDEHMAGKKLLDYMRDAKIFNRALFITRHYDGKHIGPQCFDGILQAAKSAVNYKPYNRISNQYQFLWTKVNGRRGVKSRRGPHRSKRGGFSGTPFKHIDDVSDNKFCTETSEASSADEEVVLHARQ